MTNVLNYRKIILIAVVLSINCKGEIRNHLTNNLAINTDCITKIQFNKKSNDSIWSYVDSVVNKQFYVNKKYQDTIWLYTLESKRESQMILQFDLHMSKNSYLLDYPLLGYPTAKIESVSENMPKIIRNKYGLTGFVVKFIYSDYCFCYLLECDKDFFCCVKYICEHVNMDDVFIDEIKNSLDTVEKIILTKIDRPITLLNKEMIQTHTIDSVSKNAKIEYVLRKNTN
jgi:hypothetical protein